MNRFALGTAVAALLVYGAATVADAGPIYAWSWSPDGNGLLTDDGGRTPWVGSQLDTSPNGRGAAGPGIRVGAMQVSYMDNYLTDDEGNGTGGTMPVNHPVDPVPEPASLALLGLGMVGYSVGHLRKRRGNRSAS